MEQIRNAPIGQDYVVALKVPDTRKYFVHDPNLARTDKGTLLIAAPEWDRATKAARYVDADRHLRMARSRDGGRTWSEGSTLPYQEGTPFVLDGRLLMFVQQKSHCDFQIVASDDDGITWSRPQTVLSGPLWNISTARVVRDDAMYWAMDHDLPERIYGGKVMVRLDRSRSPFDPGAWSLSNVVAEPDLPAVLYRGLYRDRRGFRFPFTWLEPNTVDVGGRLRVLARCVIDRAATASMAAVLDYDPAANRLELTQLAPWPGGQCKFFVLYDAPSGLYWMLGNLVTNSQNLVAWDPRELERYTMSPGNERRWLFLHYSLDCLNWFPAGCVACWPDHIRRSFMYPSAVVDGEDLVILSRTSRDAEDQHDADLCTVHRVTGFRSLALDLRAGQPMAMA